MLLSQKRQQFYAVAKEMQHAEKKDRNSFSSSSIFIFGFPV